MAVQFGYKLPNCAGVLCEPEWVDPETIAGLAQLAESRGFDSLWLHDHLLTPAELKQVQSPDALEPTVLLGWLASLVQNLAVGVATFVVPFRDPVLMAKQLATLDVLYPGRIIAGVGIGQYESEFESLGLDTYRQRGRVTDEYLDIIRALFAGEPSTVSGNFRSIREASFHPRPPSGNVPLWVGGGSEAAIKRAARIGDGWVPASMTPERVSAGRDLLETELNGRGRTVSDVTIALSLTIEREQDASRHKDMESRGLHAHSSAIGGNSEQVTSLLNEFVEAGVEHFLLSLPEESVTGVSENISWFSEEVAPAFHSKQTAK